MRPHPSGLPTLCGPASSSSSSSSLPLSFPSRTPGPSPYHAPCCRRRRLRPLLEEPSSSSRRRAAARPSSSPPPPPPPVVLSRPPHPSPSSCFFRAPEVAVRLAGWCGQPVAWVCGPMPSNAEHGEGGTCAPKCRSAEPKEAVGGRAQSPGADVGGQRPAAQGAVLRAVLIAHGSRAHLVCI